VKGDLIGEGDRDTGDLELGEASVRGDFLGDKNPAFEGEADVVDGCAALLGDKNGCCGAGGVKI
jgi:hypothetical protein